MTRRIVDLIKKCLWSMACAALGEAVLVAAQEATRPRAVAQDLDKKMMAAVAKHDPMAVAAMYADAADVVFTGDGIEKTRGRQGITDMWKSLFAQGLGGLELKVSDVDLTNGVMTESGAFSMTSTSGQVIRHGRYRFEWIKDAGAWKLRHHEATAAK